MRKKRNHEKNILEVKKEMRKEVKEVKSVEERKRKEEGILLEVDPQLSRNLPLPLHVITILVIVIVVIRREAQVIAEVVVEEVILMKEEKRKEKVVAVVEVEGEGEDEEEVEALHEAEAHLVEENMSPEVGEGIEIDLVTEIEEEDQEVGVTLHHQNNPFKDQNHLVLPHCHQSLLGRSFVKREFRHRQINYQINFGMVSNG